ncbi:hypothetical protein DHW03_06430 [Pedobacter yonginense]|uniref:Response regulatory domain-containing protein n=2 Tax=Pedobacter yonginense TaxID=651869 RepID=A0A317ETT5_9SPHI|nr:hypothetical protein DHW03_06430 [Pedobacter yonginense]
MIIDDDNIALFLHSTILNDYGMVTEPEVFNSALPALKHFEKDDDNVANLIFLDINMPVMNGWSFLEAIKDHANDNNTKVVIVTSSTEASEREKANAYSLVKGFCTKPLNEQQLIKLQADAQLAPFFRL